MSSGWRLVNAVRAMTLVESARAKVRPHVATLLLDLIARVAPTDCMIEGRSLKAGQALLGIRTIAKRLGLSDWEVRVAIKFLEQARKLTHQDDVVTFTDTSLYTNDTSQTHTLLTHFSHTPNSPQVFVSQPSAPVATSQTHTVVSSSSSSPCSSEPHAGTTPVGNTSGGVGRGGNGRPKRQRVQLAPPDDEAQHRAVALAAEFYAGMDLEPTKPDISTIRALILTESLTDEQVRGIIKTNREKENMEFWQSPSVWLHAVGQSSKPVWRKLLEKRAAKILRYGNDEEVPF